MKSIFLTLFYLAITTSALATAKVLSSGDTVQLTPEFQAIQSSIGQKIYSSDSTWHDGQYLNTGSNITGWINNVSQDYYESGISYSNITFRQQGVALIVLNGIPLNTYDIEDGLEFKPNSSYQYLSSSEINSTYAIKGNQSSSIYGSYGNNGAIFLNSYSPKNEGLSLRLNSDFVHQNNKELANGYVFRNGIHLGYKKQSLSTTFSAEHLRESNSPTSYEKGPLNGFNFSTNTKLDIVDKVSLSLYLNYFDSKINNEINTALFTNTEQSQNDTRYIGGLAINYQPFDFLSLKAGTSKVKKISTNDYSNGTSNATNKKVWNQTYHSLEIEYNQSLKKIIGLQARLGLRQLNKNFDSEFKTTSAFPVESRFESEDRYLLGELILDYKKTLFLGSSINSNENSTLPIDQNKIRFTSYFGSFVFTKLLNQKSKILSRGSLKVALSNLDIVSPQKNTEVTLDLNFAEDKIGLVMTYWFKEEKEEFTNPGVSPTTGYSSVFLNSGNQKFSAYEFSLTSHPVNNWHIGLHWAKNNIEVLDFTSSQNYSLTTGGQISTNATVGQPFGTLTGTGLAYPDGSSISGSSNGLLSIGSSNPDWTSSLFNTVKFGNFTLGCLITYRKGGDQYELLGNNDLSADSNGERVVGGGGVLSEGLDGDGAFYWENSSRNPSTFNVYESNALVLRNIYLNYSFKNILKLNSINIGLSAKNLLAKTSLPDNRIPADYNSSNYIGNIQTKSYSLNLSIDF